MPTGYTHIIDYNKNTTFVDYLKKCVGAFIRRKPEDCKSTADRYSEHLDKCFKSFIEFVNLNDEQLTELFIEYKLKSIDQLTGYKTNNDDLRMRYQRISDETHRWNPPEKLKGLKEFMLEQLETGAPLVSGDTYDSQIKKLEEMTFQDWIEEKIDSMKSEINYAIEDYQRELLNYYYAKDFNDLVQQEIYKYES